MLEEARTKWNVVSRLLLFQKSYIEREVWRERVVGLARTEGWRMTGSVVKCSKKHERSGRCIAIASVPEVLYREGGLEKESGRIRSGRRLADDGKCT